MTACILGHLLSSDEWSTLMFLLGLYLLYVEQLMHLYDLGSAVHSFKVWVPAHWGQVTSPLQLRNLWLNLEHLKHLFATM